MRCLVLDGPHKGRRHVPAEALDRGRVTLALPCPFDWTEEDYELHGPPLQTYQLRPATHDEFLRLEVEAVAFT